jgi:hypothetical protein
VLSTCFGVDFEMCVPHHGGLCPSGQNPVFVVKTPLEVHNRLWGTSNGLQHFGAQRWVLCEALRASNVWAACSKGLQPTSKVGKSGGFLGL